MLKFRLFGIPVGVHLTFLFVALLGASAYRGVDIAIWTAAAFISILMHELGHALTARAFDARGVNITLYGLGGVTTYSHGGVMTHGRSFLVSAAGSFVGIVAGGAVWLLARNGVFDGVSHEVAVFLDSFVFTALVWGVLNWIPIVPLDGGHMVESLAGMINPRKAPLIGQVITWIAVAIVVPLALMNGYQFAAIIVVLFALSGVREYRQREAAIKASEQAQQGVVQPDEIRPAPPADPTPPPERQNPPEFPI
jgi:Zn-dependent protease